MDDAERLKTWSLEEANEAIPIITKAFDGIFYFNNQVESLSKDISTLHEIWGAGLLEPNNPDYHYYKQLRQRRMALQQRVDLAVSELQHIGITIDDIKHGVVHFYHKTPRGVVVFCWRYGEQNINHWHELGQRAMRKQIVKRGLRSQPFHA